jgi:regulatory protein
MAGRRRRQGEPDELAADGTRRDLGPEADPESVARTIILTRLTARARSRKELEDALAQRDAPAEVAGKVLDRFEEVGLVDDTGFAKEWARSRQQTRGLSARALRYELRGKGVAAEQIDEALDDLGPEAERQAAVEIVERKLRSMASLPPDVARRRLLSALARNGFGAGLSDEVVREALADVPSLEPAEAFEFDES